MMMDDFTFHLAHRIFHCKSKYFPLYKLFHKKHHEFIHSVSITAVYSHPVEFIFVNLLPLMSGMLFLGKNTHLFTYIIYGFFRVVESHESHSGYEIPSYISVLTGNIYRIMPIFQTSSSYHDFHHFKNVGNYSSFLTIWDTIFQSNESYYAEEFKKES